MWCQNWHKFPQVLGVKGVAKRASASGSALSFGFFLATKPKFCRAWVRLKMLFYAPLGIFLASFDFGDDCLFIIFQVIEKKTKQNTQKQKNHNKTKIQEKTKAQKIGCLFSLFLAQKIPFLGQGSSEKGDEKSASRSRKRPKDRVTRR